ncbi:hypothetical protein [Mesorhizobium sp. BE184]|uniref:hypothetical protein n=1 Tax=Mesorhizobium sp. BE184 TaxID=2817714 RepID=UPI0028639F0C|nr:hypothetical protein [Mesorhizobium sp. BE184]MDR7032911.1 hypothetical protein [Mesorhizobium sp. BE184]
MAAHAHAEPGEAFVEETINLSLKWQQTWEENEADYSAFSSVYKGAVGRIYRHDAGPSQGQWLWSMVADGYDISRAGPCSGHERSPRRAAKRVEDAWFDAIKGSSLDRAEKRNAYAMAKAGE